MTTPQWVEILTELIPITDNATVNTYVTKLLERHRPDVKVYIQPTENNEASLVLMAGTPKTLFVAHTDVVPAKSDEWENREPYKLTIKGEALTGRGVVDNKSHVALLLDILLNQQLKNVAVVLTAGEETRLWGARSLYIPPPIQRVVVLEPTHNQVITQHLGTSGYEFVFRSSSGHSSQRPASSHPVLRAIQFIQKFPKPRDSVINVGRIYGGEKLNVVPAHCTVGVNYRYLLTTPDQWITKVKERVIVDDVIELFNFVPFHSSASTQTLKIFKKAGARLAKKRAPFYSEAAVFEQRGFPTVLWGIGDIQQAHKINETALLPEIEEGKNTLLELIKKLR